MDAFINLNAIAAIEDAEIGNLQPRRIFHIRDKPFQTLSEKQFIRTYRLSKDLVRELLPLVEPYIPDASRTSALNVTTKVLTALNFFAYGSYQLNIEQNVNAAISQSSVSRSVEEVVNALNQPAVFHSYVRFPSTLEQLQDIRTRFYNQYNVPGIIGCLNCTHVAIYPPYGNEEYDEHSYVNRKGYHSMNTQIICDSNYRSINILGSFPGSTHDAFIWTNSNVKRFMENLHRNGHKSFFLLGDSGYPLRPYLLTPLDHVLQHTPEWRYNVRHRSIRSIIERCNGILKHRFRCLLKHRGLHYAPPKAGRIINACAVLHNMCIDAHLPEVGPEPEDAEVDYGLFDQHDDNRNIEIGRGIDALYKGRQQRNRIVRNYM